MIEFQRCLHAESFEHVKKVLDEAGIPYQSGTNAGNFDITTIGTGGEYEAIVSIRASDYSAAREAMENDSLESDLPADHYLLSSTDTALAGILENASEWSAFDVAHARRIMESRGLNPADFEENSEQKLKKLSQGKPASKTLLFFGWLGAITGGLIGIGIGWSLCSMKEKTPQGEFPTYDARSREIGCIMSRVAFIVLIITISLRYAYK